MSTGTRGQITAGQAVIVVTIDNQIQNALKKIEAQVRKFAAGIGQIGFDMFRGGLLGSIPVFASIKEFQDFEDEILRLGTKLQTTDRILARVEERIRSLGKTTSFTALEVAKGATSLAQAGLTPQEVMDGLQSVLDLARGAKITLDESADLLANTSATFKIPVDQFNEIASQFIATARLSTIEVINLKEAIKEASGTLNDLNIDLPTSLALLAQLGFRSLKGTKAGTTLNTMLLNLVAKMKQIGKVLNVEISNIDGSMRPILEVLDEFSTKIQKLPETQRIRLSQQLFNIRGSRGETALREIDKIRRLAQEIRTAGDEARLAAQKMDSGLGGSVRRATSAINDLAISLGKNLSPTLQRLLDLVPALSASIDELVTKFPLLTTLVLTLPPGILAVGTGLLITSFALGKFATLLGVVGSAAGLAFKTLTSLGASLKSSINTPVLLAVGAVGRLDRALAKSIFGSGRGRRKRPKSLLGASFTGPQLNQKRIFARIGQAGSGIGGLGTRALKGATAGVSALTVGFSRLGSFALKASRIIYLMVRTLDQLKKVNKQSANSISQILTKTNRLFILQSRLQKLTPTLSFDLGLARLGGNLRKATFGIELFIVRFLRLIRTYKQARTELLAVKGGILAANKIIKQSAAAQAGLVKRYTTTLTRLTNMQKAYRTLGARVKATTSQLAKANANVRGTAPALARIQQINKELVVARAKQNKRLRDAFGIMNLKKEKEALQVQVRSTVFARNQIQRNLKALKAQRAAVKSNFLVTKAVNRQFFERVPAQIKALTRVRRQLALKNNVSVLRNAEIANISKTNLATKRFFAQTAVQAKNAGKAVTSGFGKALGSIFNKTRGTQALKAGKSIGSLLISGINAVLKGQWISTLYKAFAGVGTVMTTFLRGALGFGKFLFSFNGIFQIATWLYLLGDSLDFTKKILDAFRRGFGAFGKELGQIGRLAGPAFTQIGNGFSLILQGDGAAGVEQLIAGLQNLASIIVNQVLAGFNKMLVELAPGLEFLYAFFKSLWELLKLVGSTAASIGAPLQEIGKNNEKSFSDTLSEIFSISNMVEGFKELGLYVEGFATALASLATTGFEFLGNAIKFMTDTFAMLLGTLRDFVADNEWLGGSEAAARIDAVTQSVYIGGRQLQRDFSRVSDAMEKVPNKIAAAGDKFQQAMDRMEEQVTGSIKAAAEARAREEKNRAAAAANRATISNFFSETLKTIGRFGTGTMTAPQMSAGWSWAKWMNTEAPGGQILNRITGKEVNKELTAATKSINAVGKILPKPVTDGIKKAFKDPLGAIGNVGAILANPAGLLSTPIAQGAAALAKGITSSVESTSLPEMKGLYGAVVGSFQETRGALMAAKGEPEKQTELLKGIRSGISQGLVDGGPGAEPFLKQIRDKDTTPRFE